MRGGRGKRSELLGLGTLTHILSHSNNQLRSFAFFAGAVSSITSLRCFGIYTGLVVICDFFLMITYLPAVVILDHVYIQPRMKNCCNCFSAIKEKICGCCKATDDDIDESSGATLGTGER